MVLDLRERIAHRLKTLVASPMPRGDKAAVTLAIASSKGGVGKTTTAVSLAVGLARRGLKTLLVDLDPQAHVAASLQSDVAPGQPALADVLTGKLREVLEAARRSRFANLDLAGSEKILAETETILAAKIGKELILDGALAATRSHYDAVVIDCPPNLGTLTLNALCAADFLLVPTDMSVLALEGVGDILAAVDTVRSRLGRHLEILGILATRVDRRATQVNGAIEQSFADLYGDRLMATRVPASSAVNKAHLAGKPIFEFARHSPAAIAYDALTDEVAGRLGLAVMTVPAAATATANGARLAP
ncbi:MAG: ParA family protein [Deltaproteobacteria bacterium]|nr:ParA family protein [Deltaproteobacteria bacterium]